MFTFSGFEALSTLIEVSQSVGVWTVAGLLAYGEYRVYKDRQSMADQVNNALAQYQLLKQPKAAMTMPAAVIKDPSGMYM